MNPAENYIQFDRVRNQTPAYVNERIDILTRGYIDQVSKQGRQAIEGRIAELDREWDVDRALMLNFAIIGGSTFTAGISGRKGWLYFFGTQIFFLGLHALKGWCPPASVFRRMGFRTRNEIEAEKHELLMRLSSQSKMAA